MDTHNNAQPGPSERRITELEQSITFLQRAVDDLDKVLVGVQRRLDTLEGDLLHLAQRMALTSRREDENRSLEDDRPPHY